MTNIIDQYKMLLNSVPRLIEISGYKNEYVAKKLEMTPTYFSAKKYRGSWTVDEVEKILKTISNEDVEEFLDDMVFEKSFHGKLLGSKEFEKRMGWK